MLSPCQEVPCPAAMCQWSGRGREMRVRSSFPLLAQIQSGIGRLILREEMKARSNSYADPWTPPRSSASSREALHTAGYEGSLNGCKDSSVRLSVCPSHGLTPVGSLLGWKGKNGGLGRGCERCARH